MSLKKNPRGTSTDYVADVGGVDISVTTWVDNKIVTLASNYAGIVPKDTACRYNKAKKEYIEIATAKYNSYKILLRSKRWHVRLFYHLIDLTVIEGSKGQTDILGKTRNKMSIGEAKLYH